MLTIHLQSDQLLQPNTRLHGSFCLGTSGPKRRSLQPTKWWKRRLLYGHVIYRATLVKRAKTGGHKQEHERACSSWHKNQSSGRNCFDVLQKKHPAQKEFSHPLSAQSVATKGFDVKCGTLKVSFLRIRELVSTTFEREPVALGYF